jgi:hypothetical protein
LAGIDAATRQVQHSLQMSEPRRKAAASHETYRIHSRRRNLDRDRQISLGLGENPEPTLLCVKSAEAREKARHVPMKIGIMPNVSSIAARK